jgi:hypothetical protein
MLAIKIFSWFYQKWISKNKIKSANGGWLTFGFGFSIWAEAEFFQVFGQRPDVKMHLRSFTGQ